MRPERSRRFPRRRISGRSGQGAALRDSLIRIQAEQPHSDCSNRGKRFNRVTAQFEVVGPAVASRMEQRHELSGFRID